MRPGTWACHILGRAPSTHLAPGPWPTLNVTRVDEYVLDSSWIRMALHPSATAAWLRELGQVLGQETPL